MTSKTGAQLLVDCLRANGADTVFGVPGESYLAVLDALYDAQGIDYVVCRQEGGAAMAAEAYGKLTGRAGICMVTRGPGATNASAGVHVGFQDSTPMILFVGQVGRSMTDREAFQEIDYRRMFGQMAKWVAQIDDAARVPEYLQRAFATAMNGRPGPVVLALPEDMLRDEVDTPVLPPAAPRVEIAPPPAALDALRDHLAAAERPLMIVGGGGWGARIRTALADFAAANRIPVAASFRAQDYLDNRDPHYVGHVGIGIDPKLAERVRAADLLVVFGPRLGEMTTSGYRLIDVPVPAQKLVHIHADVQELARVYAPSLAINATPAAMAEALAGLGRVRERSGDWLEAARADYLAYSRPTRSAGAVQMADIVTHLRNELADDAIITNGAGNYAIWVHRFFGYRGYRTQLAPTSGSMGYGLPAAVAAGRVYPDREVVCFAGDGCAMMTIQEFATAVQHRLKVIMIVVNNGMFGTIRMHQEKTYPGRVSGTGLTNPDFAALARACGGYGETVRRTEDFPAALDRARNADGPALIEIQTDPEAITPAATLSGLRAGA